MVKCRQCGSDKVIPDVALQDSYGDSGGLTHEAKVKVHGAPQAWILKDSCEGQVSLSICGDCGHAELHVSNARELWEKYQRARDQ